MKIISKTFVSLLVVILTLSACTPGVAGAQVAQSNKARINNPQASPDDLQTLAADNDAFALDLYQQLRSSQGNLFFSPYSISVALAMTYAGALGDTASQMAQTMHFSLPPDRLHPAFNALGLDLANRPKQAGKEVKTPFELSIANALWGQQNFTFQPAFLDLLAQNYGAGMRLVDFASNAEGARQTINRWVSDETRGKIKDLIPSGALDSLTRLVLTNAIYFKAGWLNQFEKTDTQPAPFNLLDGSSVQAEMMNQTDGFQYAQLEDIQAIELPYESGNISMLVILPAAGKFQAVEESLTPQRLAEIQAAMQSGQVRLSFPKFTFDSEFNLNAALKSLGMVDAFDKNQADFSGMTGKPDLYISDVQHKAFVAVDETGTEAAAATAVIMGLTSALPQQPVEIKVDRPFIFMIRDNQTGSLLFVGRVLNPLK